jgi:hypothetical protein
MNGAVPTTRVTSWDELLRELYANSWRKGIQRHRLTCAFHGLSQSSQSLVTGLMRLGGEYWRVERAMLRAFRKYARHQIEPFESSWDWLAIAQHHGLPTRLLDWTYSPFVALHFATAANRNDESVIWTLDYQKSNELLPKPLRRVLEEEDADVFTAEMLDAVVENLDELTRMSAKPFVLFLEPPSLDSRIANQFALFSLLSDPRTRLDAWLEEHPHLARRIVLGPEVKAAARDMLDQANVTERVLFPGLDGLSQYLARYYLPTVSVTPSPSESS